MDRDELAWLVVLAEREHVTSAAAQLHITPSALSRALARVEHELGAPLFDREGRRVRLNEAGRIFSEHARRALDEIKTAQARITDLSDPGRGQLRLAYLYWLESWIVPEMLALFRRDWPAVRFALRSGPPAAVLDLLQRGDVDFALTSGVPTDPHVVWQLVRRERLYLAVPAGHPLCDRQSVGVGELRHEEFVLPEPGTEIRSIADRLFGDCGFNPSVAMESLELGAFRAFVAAGFGVAILPPWHSWQAGPTNLCYVPLTDEQAYRDVGLAWRRERVLSPLGARFLEFAAALRDVVPGWSDPQLTSYPESRGELRLATPVNEYLDVVRRQAG